MEGDEPAIEQMVDRRREEQAVLAGQSLLIRAVSPGLDVAGSQMFRALDLGDTAALLDPLNPLAEQSLTSPRENESFLLRRREPGIVLDPGPKMLLPEHDLRRGNETVFCDELRPCKSPDLGSDQVGEHEG